MGLTGTFVASETFGEAQSLVAALPKVHVAQILGLSLVSQVFLGFLPVWTWREAVMRSEDASLYMAFVFPPLSVSLCIGITTATTLCYVNLLLPRLRKQQDKVKKMSQEALASEDTPLLGRVEEDV